MALEGLHHVTAITADARATVEFYARLLGLRMVKKTVNFDAPDVYHLYFGDEHARPGSILTFFEFPGAQPGRAGAGMVHRIVWRVAEPGALSYWRQRLESAGVQSQSDDRHLRFADDEGLAHELVGAGDGAPWSAEVPLAAESDVPAEHRLLGLEGVRAYARDPGPSGPLLQALGFEGAQRTWRARGDRRSASLTYDQAPATPAASGAGTVHHVAWTARDDDDLERWRAVLRLAGAHPTEIIDRQYFHSVYFREPSGVLFELATPDPGFAVDEPPEALGERLALPTRYEPLRERLEAALTPLGNPRVSGGA